MLTVDDYEIIRRKHRDEGLSQREILSSSLVIRERQSKKLWNLEYRQVRLTKPRPKADNRDV
ncbi:MAG: hypothetical protein A2Y10_12385 [Planctomycetes bacterium GWF2_41_51]|nr:MAG: hypothetical protein A2Y10_12385 [Planctomycetes bacterium GWF2_41_51]HBG27220.1 hypothetical protein [Phycisphaerales bacterium]